MIKPDNVNILGRNFAVEYVDNPSDVDSEHRKSLWGQYDSWAGVIRIYTGVGDDEIFDTLLHETLHGIINRLKIKTIESAPDYEDVVSLLALGLADVLVRNGWLK